jgi:hypothetical protein
LPHGGRGNREFVQVADSRTSTLRHATQKRSPRKRVVHERPARMIDDAVRSRAMEAVRRALESESSPA